jgi:acetyl/propionyl-CoA carboxylase alpha subunit
VIHLGERDCSIQRRHQKVVEESPSALLDDELRHKMGEAAVNAARACGYVNAGTVEFLVDKNRNFYFLEMNTRLQVEHPVTEMVSGMDLVREQINIACGEELSRKENLHAFWGHAVECRIYAEDFYNNFAPSPGKITFLRPADGPGIREDSGFAQGDEVSLYYDPMISKLIAWGSDRRQAVERMRRALTEYELIGIKSNIPVLKRIMENEDFKRGRYNTAFIEENMEQLGSQEGRFTLPAVIGSVLCGKPAKTQHKFGNEESKGRLSAWKLIRRKQNWV